MGITNKSKSVLDRLKNQAKKASLPFQTVLQLFAQEEFLRKLSLSKYNENFILKGGMLIYTLTNYESRPTKDIDFMLRNLSSKLDDISAAIENICRIDTDNDFILVNLTKVEQIGTKKHYPGARISLLATIDKVKIPFSIDIGINDAVVPPPVKRTIKPRLEDFSSPEIYIYSLESTVAEKFDAILERMSATSRMKDFFDIYYLQRRFDFDGGFLQRALKSTLKHRNRKIYADAFIDIKTFASNKYLLKQWGNFKPAADACLSFENVITGINDFLEPVYKAIIENGRFKGKWDCVSQVWKFKN